MTRTPDHRTRARDKARGAAFFNALRDDQKGDLGDKFVLGTFDWRDWLEARPSSAFLNGAEEARLYWEVTS